MTYRIDLSDEKRQLVEAAAARLGVAVETFIESAVESQAQSTIEFEDCPAQLGHAVPIGAARPIGGSVEIGAREMTDVEMNVGRVAIQQERIKAVRGKRAHLRGTVDDFLRERHAEAEREMQKDFA